MTIRWVTDIPETPILVLGNDLRFEQMLDKLLDNARDYTNRGRDYHGGVE